MKRLIPFTILIMLSINVVSQDAIITHKGDEIQSKVIEITNDLIKYKNFDHLEGPIRNINISEVFMIIYENGSREIFKKKNVVEKTKIEAKSESEKIMDERVSSFKDNRDGKEYITVKIGDQWWMAQNLDFDSKHSNTMRDSNYAKIDTIYGRLYSLEVCNKVCPAGWHLPSEEEWEVLVNYLGGAFVAGGKMKVPGTKYWDEPNTGATNSSLFSALAYNGQVKSKTDRSYSKKRAEYWTSTKRFLDGPIVASLSAKYATAYVGVGSEGRWRSIRCIKD